MTQELTPKQRLTQIEKILHSAIKLSHSNTAKIEANTEMIDRIGQKIVHSQFHSRHWTIMAEEMPLRQMVS